MASDQFEHMKMFSFWEKSKNGFLRLKRLKSDVTLGDEDTKSILTDNANMAIQGNQAMRVTNSLVCKFVSNVSGAIWWSIL